MKKIKMFCIICLMIIGTVLSVKAVKANSNGIMELPETNIGDRHQYLLKQKNVNEDDYYNVKTFRLEIFDAPAKVQKWVKKSKSSKDIYVKKYNGRYWVYTNAIGNGNDYSFHISVMKKNKIAKLSIKLNKKTSGSGYALLSVPEYEQLTIKCGNYSTKIKKN